MGNSHCVPQAPRRFRASFSRKPSLKGNREDSARKLAGLFGTEAARDRDTAAADKLFRYIPGTDIPGLESQPEPLEQPFLSVFKKGRQRVPVRNLGKVVHYAKVQLRFPHSQDVSDCYLELFPSHLYFQAHSPEGLTFQGLLPLTELSVCPVEGSQEHAFQITGPLPAPLLLLCPSEAERDRWLYHLEKQVALVRGLQRCHSAPPQHHLSRLRTASGRELVGSAVCASRVRLQHLPSQEQWERLLVLYPASLAIFSEETDGLCFKGELPLSAVGIQLEEEEKQAHSFLIEGPLINTIRVLCASYEDYSHWLCCLRTMSRRDPRPPLARLTPGCWAVGGSRGSLSADGQASWGSGCPVPPSTRTSHSLPGSSVPAQPALDQASPVCTSISCRRAELRRSGSSRSPRSKAGAEGPGTAAPRHLRLDLTELSRLSLEGGPEAPDHTLETPHSPLYADPYTPPATSHRKITDVRGLDEFLSALRSCPGPAPSSPFPSVPVSVPVSDPGSGPSSSPGPPGPHLLSRKGALQSRAAQRHRGSVKGGGPQRPDSPQLVAPAREGSPAPLPPLAADDRSPRRREGPGYDNSWNKMSSPSQQTWARLGEPGAEGVVVQWI
ncbi:PREDICTED: pleckstrin homology domain-containing family N member 1 [Propithecus coquereli]|uniref:pleckstrin homology domain-containing family N member 1 n=1 Tax=Propithecus coquereli TaxID=379532 RepID=UPI00063F1653|nr:PREDICTED: pleckstrin homology domain-containing family N member 1 [Propithecus coquereli]